MTMHKRWQLSALLLCLMAGPGGARAQTAPPPRWIQPYAAAAPEYWELVGKLFEDSMEIARDATLAPITAPAVLALATVKPRAQAGDVAASFVNLTFNGSPENLAQLEDPHFVVKDMAQVRFIKAGTLGVMIDVRTASSSDGHMLCIYSRLQKSAFLLDGLARAITLCDNGATWSSWQRQPERYPFNGTFALDGTTVLAFSLDPATDSVRTTIQNPPAR
jgi:hypothetical protein